MDYYVSDEVLEENVTIISDEDRISLEKGEHAVYIRLACWYKDLLHTWLTFLKFLKRRKIIEEHVTNNNKNQVFFCLGET